MTTLDSDLIRRGDAIEQIQKKMKTIYTAARRQGYKETKEILASVPARRQPVQYQPVIVVSPDIGHSHWFYAGGHRFCYNCGGEGDIRFVTRLCPHCGFIMDELHDMEIE